MSNNTQAICLTTETFSSFLKSLEPFWLKFSRAAHFVINVWALMGLGGDATLLDAFTTGLITNKVRPFDSLRNSLPCQHVRASSEAHWLDVHASSEVPHWSDVACVVWELKRTL